MKSFFLALLLATLVVYFNGLKAQEFEIFETTTLETNENTEDDYIDNEIDMKKTYVSGVEKFLQSLTRTILLPQSSNIAEKLFSQLPKSVRAFFTNQDNDIATSRENGFGDALNAFREDFHAVFPGNLISSLQKI